MMNRRRLRLCALAVLIFASGAEIAFANSPLADAAERNDAVALRTLLSEGAGVNAVQADGMAALHWAVYHEDLSSAKLLIEAGAEVQAENRYGAAPLSLACLNGNAGLVELLLEHGADPNVALPGGETALMTAARTGRVGPVELLLARGAEVDARERKGQTALMWAAAEGHVEAVDALLKGGADLEASLSSGFTPLFFAVREGRIRVVLRLLEAGADVNATMPGKDVSPLLLAVENGHFELAAGLLDAGADPNDQRSGHAALHAITWVRKPIRGDGDPAPIGSGKLSSLEFVRRLVEYGGEVNIRVKRGRAGRAQFNTNGATPFLLAASTSDLPLMRLLLELGADPEIPNAVGSTPILAAAGIGDLGSGREAAGTEQEAIEAVRLLLELGADINAIDENGETVMHGAVYQIRPKLVRLLAENGADIDIWNQKNEWGWTPLLIARGYRQGNFRPAPTTIQAVESVMREAGVTPPSTSRKASGPDYKK